MELFPPAHKQLEKMLTTYVPTPNVLYFASPQTDNLILLIKLSFSGKISVLKRTQTTGRPAVKKHGVECSHIILNLLSNAFWF